MFWGFLLNFRDGSTANERTDTNPMNWLGIIFVTLWILDRGVNPAVICGNCIKNCSLIKQVD